MNSHNLNNTSNSNNSKQYKRPGLLSIDGRVSRLNWWVMHIICAVLISILYPLAIIIPFMFAVIILLYVVTILNAIKRLHDTNRSGYHYLFTFIPVFGFFYILIVCGFFASNEGTNKYGLPPV